MAGRKMRIMKRTRNTWVNGKTLFSAPLQASASLHGLFTDGCCLAVGRGCVPHW